MPRTRPYLASHGDSRDEKIREQAHRHVCIADHFLGFFPSAKACYRRIAILRKKRFLRCVGIVLMNPTGRPHYAYCNSFRPKADQLRHDVLLTTFLLCYPSAQFRRGPDVDPQLLADAEIKLGSSEYYVELDTGTESYAQVKRRQALYANAARASGSNDRLVLWITLSDRRMQGLMEHSQAIEDLAVFTTLSRVVADPHGEIWFDRQGNVGRVEAS